MKGMTTTMKVKSLAAVIFLTGIMFAGQAHADAILNASSDLYFGVAPGEPSSLSDEVIVINFLTGLAINTTVAGPSSPPSYQRSDNLLCTPNCETATTEDAVRINSNSTSVFVDDNDYMYLLAKYDGPNFGDAIWLIDGITGTITIPSCLQAGANGQTGSSGSGTCFGLSHVSLFNPGDQTEVPEPSTLLLVGSGLMMLSGISRKYLRSQK
jgi:hypothetical protein